VIYAINGNPINRSDDYLIEINDAVVGQTMEFTVIRQGEKITKKMLLRQRDKR